MSHGRSGKHGPVSGMRLSRSFAAKICAVEGLALSPALERTFDEFDQKRLTPAQRRAEIWNRFQRKTPQR